MKVKFILPALTEATSPYWRPIKYSLFPPLGLATLAADVGSHAIKGERQERGYTYTCPCSARRLIARSHMRRISALPG